MQIRIRSVDFWVDECTTRIPFRFGMTTMTAAPLLTARATIETESGDTGEGCSADLLVPKWFEKDPDKTPREDCEALVDSARRAAASWWSPTTPPSSVFDHWWRVYRERVHATPADAADRLVRGFGVALVERAVIDAACRAAGRSFFEALREDVLGFRPDAVHPELAGWSLADSLPAKPSQRVELRHTVGLADPLRGEDGGTGDGRAGNDPRDGLPYTLEENVRAYGLRVFKVKIGGDGAEDLARLRAVAEVLTDAVDAPRWTADGNEQFTDLARLARLLDELERDPAGRRFLEGLLYVEQPLPRARSFDPAATAELPALTQRVPVILDEADHGIEAFPRGLELGYRGVSVKNCKGVFRALLNRGVCERHGAGAFQSAEDLTNLGVVALGQDLATVAALGLPHVERNGHHYFHGLDHLPPAEVRAALAAHASLYRPLASGATLRIEDGTLDLASLQAPGYGHGIELDLAARTPLAEWTFAEPAR